MKMTLCDFIGLIGVFLALYAYARVQWQRDFAKSLVYSLLNFLSSALMLVSLSQAWNSASVVSNVTWAALSLYGVYRCVKFKLREHASLMPPEAHTQTTCPCFSESRP